MHENYWCVLLAAEGQDRNGLQLEKLSRVKFCNFFLRVFAKSMKNGCGSYGPFFNISPYIFPFLRSNNILYTIERACRDIRSNIKNDKQPCRIWTTRTSGHKWDSSCDIALFKLSQTFPRNNVLTLLYKVKVILLYTADLRSVKSRQGYDVSKNLSMKEVPRA